MPKRNKHQSRKTHAKHRGFLANFFAYFTHPKKTKATKRVIKKRPSTKRRKASTSGTRAVHATKRRAVTKRVRRVTKKKATLKKSRVSAPVAVKNVTKLPQDEDVFFESIHALGAKKKPKKLKKTAKKAEKAEQENASFERMDLAPEENKDSKENKESLQSSQSLQSSKENGKEEKQETEYGTSSGLDIEFAGEESALDKKDSKERENQKNQKKKAVEKEEKALKQEMEKEGFLESTTKKKTKKHTLLSFLGKGDKGKKPLTKKGRKEQAKKEKKEEKGWAEEAERREDLIKMRKEEHKKEVKFKKKKIEKWKPLEDKKQNSFQAFISSIKYIGLGKEKIAFIDNLGMMMDAGLPLLDGLRSLQKETRVRPMKKIVGRIIIAVEQGSSLWRAMQGQYFFSDQQIAMVRVGEEAGNLVENLQYLSIQEEKDRELRSKVRTAMIYPIIVLTMLTLIVFGLGMFVLPNLISVIDSLGVPLPFTTRVIVAFTTLFSEHGTVILPSFLGGVFVFAILTKYTKLKILVQWSLYKIPGIGTLIREATLSRFGVVMGGLLQAGVPITEALDSLVSATTLVRYKNFYAQLSEHIKLGDSFATSFEAIASTNKCFPPSMQQLVVTGEQSGSLTKIMLKISEIHEKKASETAEKLPVILEPLLLLFIGGLVGTIALGILAPIYSVVGNIGNA